VIAAMSRSPSGPDGSTGTGTTTAGARRGGASSSACALIGTSSGAAAIRRRSSGPLPHAVPPGRLPAASASKRIAPGRGASRAAVEVE
jgi:hypothetical protein